jgi:uncharacterized protein with PIN domain
MAKCPKCEQEVSFVFEETQYDTVKICKCPKCDTAIGAIHADNIFGALDAIARKLDEIKRHVDPARL